MTQWSIREWRCTKKRLYLADCVRIPRPKPSHSREGLPRSCGMTLTWVRFGCGSNGYHQVEITSAARLLYLSLDNHMNVRGFHWAHFKSWQCFQSPVELHIRGSGIPHRSGTSWGLELFVCVRRRGFVQKTCGRQTERLWNRQITIWLDQDRWIFHGPTLECFINV